MHDGQRNPATYLNIHYGRYDQSSDVNRMSTLGLSRLSSLYVRKRSREWELFAGTTRDRIVHDKLLYSPEP
jgi:hypothetical protein